MRALRTYLVYALLPAELVLAVCLVAGVRIPPAVLTVAEAAFTLLLLANGLAFLRLRRRGLTTREALHVLVPEPALRLIAHELRLMASLGRWVARRPDRGGPDTVAAFPHARDQAALMYGFAFVCVVESVGMSYLLAAWPVVHAVVLVLDVYTVLFVLGLHAASATRPHLLTGDTLRVRQAGHVDVRIPLERIVAVRYESLFTHEKKDGELNLAVGSQTSLTLELGAPVDAPRLLGSPRPVRVVRLHADDARAMHRALREALALTQARTAPSPVPDPPVSA
ncbi:hypothetical protein KV205_03195 [Streptomyces sp. SKN60]|uniref:hypothetical protein n=1 Tax=Streptomyces sp. SKN60 TaxID=2855506 RepID=UPI002247CC3D|nr:hypothetical protein [Streptomyces sp. SKN60]MCX2179538.1 hypothetical protein [Streptomyces sp. SKN60]